MATQSNSRAPRGGPKAHACSSPHAFCSYAHPSLAAFSSPTSRRSARARRPSCGRPRPRRLRRAGSCAPTRRAARRSPRAPPACAPRQRTRAPRPNATAARRLPPRGRAAPRHAGGPPQWSSAGWAACGAPRHVPCLGRLAARGRRLNRSAGHATCCAVLSIHGHTPAKVTAQARVRAYMGWPQVSREAAAASRAAAAAAEQERQRLEASREAAERELSAARAEHARRLAGARAERAPLEAERAALLASIEARSCGGSTGACYSLPGGPRAHGAARPGARGSAPPMGCRFGRKIAAALTCRRRGAACEGCKEQRRRAAVLAEADAVRALGEGWPEGFC